MIYIVAGNRREAILYARAKLDPDEGYRYVKSADTLRGRGSFTTCRVVMCGNWRKRRDLAALEDVVNARGFVVEVGRLWGKTA